MDRTLCKTGKEKFGSVLFLFLGFFFIVFYSLDSQTVQTVLRTFNMKFIFMKFFLNFLLFFLIWVGEFITSTCLVGHWIMHMCFQVSASQSNTKRSEPLWQSCLLSVCIFTGCESTDAQKKPSWRNAELLVLPITVRDRSLSLSETDVACQQLSHRHGAEQLPQSQHALALA